MKDDYFLDHAPFIPSFRKTITIFRSTAHGKLPFCCAPEFGVSRPIVKAYMRKMGIFALVPGPHTSKPAPQHQIYPYLLRSVTAARPNHTWGIDISYVHLQQFWIGILAMW